MPIPFRYSAELNKSRIDFYNGMVKVYSIGDEKLGKKYNVSYEKIAYSASFITIITTPINLNVYLVFINSTVMSNLIICYSLSYYNIANVLNTQKYPT